MARGFVIALLGAESTGKTTLALDLCKALKVPDQRVVVINEYLREFCEREGRTPHAHEQHHIADEQTRRIEAATNDHDLVIADTTALMIAVYSDLIFGDTLLYASAQVAHAQCDLTLLTALDLAWQADGLQRDGPHVQEPVDTLVRRALDRAGLGYSVIAGTGTARLQGALACVQRATDASVPAPVPTPAAVRARWHWHCDRCGDSDCERRTLLPTI